MPVFKWEGKDRQGQSIRGQIEASNTAVAALQLRKQQIIPLVLKPEKAKRKAAFSLKFGKKVKEKEVAVFTRQLATMIGAGIPLMEAMEILHAFTEETDE